MNKNYILPIRIRNEFLPKDSTIRLLGTWALDQEDLVNAKKVDIVDYHYDDYKVLLDDFIYTKDLYTQILPIIGKLLNEYHSIDWSNRSFKIFYGMWLHDYLPVLRDRYQTIDLAIKKYPTHSFILTFDEIQIHTSSEFKQKITQDKYNHYLYTRIVKFISQEIFDDSYFLAEKKKKTSNKLLSSKSFKFILKDFIFRNIQNLINFSSKKSSGAVDRSYFSKKDFVRLILRKFNQIMPIVHFPELYPKNLCQNVSDRLDLTNKLKEEYRPKNKFEEFLVENIINDLPLSFIENFEHILNESDYFNLRNKNYLSSNAVLSNQILQFSVANQMKYPNKLIIAQHGGSYGIAKWSSQQFWELDTADTFISFGWSDAEYPNISTISHPKLIASKNKRNLDKDKILYVTGGSSRYFNRNWSHPTAGNSILNYYESMLEFLQKLDQSALSILRLRLSPSNDEYGLGVQTFLNKRVKFSNGTFIDELQNSSLIICDHNQTSFLESLTSNKPTIIFWDSNYTKISKKASFYFDELAKVGVFYNSPREAADCVNSLVVNNCISDWWMESSRQAAITSFILEYAKINDKWVDEYCSLLV